jgi:PKD repeat protein
MAEKEERGKGGGWLKAILGTLGGLVSGAVVMYFSAFVDKAVKPAKPVANFRVEYDGLTVRFHDLAPGFAGWWDFGDGSELVPVAPNQDAVPHTYERPGDYTAKMTLRNLLGEESERAVELRVGAADAAADAAAPQVEALQVTPVGSAAYAPATFHVSCKTANAKECVWDFGDGRPLELVAAADGAQERLVVFQKPGRFTVKLAAFNGGKSGEKAQAAEVAAQPDNAVGVLVTAADSGTHVLTQTKALTFNASFNPVTPAGKPCPFASTLAAPPKWTISDMQWKEGGRETRLGDKIRAALDAAALGLKGVQKLQLELAPDHSKAVLTGELLRDPGGRSGWEPTLVLPVTVVEQQKAEDRREAPAAATLTVPTAGGPASGALALPPPPDGWEGVRRTLTLAVSDGRSPTRPVPLPDGAPTKVPVVVQNRRYVLTATPEKGRVRLDLAEDKGAGAE